MGFASALVALGDGTLPQSFDGLKSSLPLDWLSSCLSQSGVATLRRRKLPVEQVVWLLIGMGLYRDRSIPELIDRLDLVLPSENGKKQFVAKGAIPPARDRLGWEPLKALFELTSKHWAARSAEKLAWRGLKVFGIDGTMLRVPDSVENREEFGLHSGSAYPLLRVVALMALRSRLIVDCSIGGQHASETVLAKELLRAVPDGSVTIFDRYFHNYSVWVELRREGRDRHWLLPVREDLNNFRVLKEFARGDELVEIRPCYATRHRNPEIPEIILARLIHYQRPGFRARTLVTSLLDPETHPAAEVAALYHERWEQELAYREIKAETLKGCPTIRSQSPERVRQELWGLFIAYNLVRREIAAAAEELNVPPNRISFRIVLALMRDLFYWAEVASPGKLPKMVQKLRLDLRRIVLPPRRERSYPRHVKLASRKYATNVGHPA